MARRKKGDKVNGWLIVDKSRDIGSTQVVNITRRLFDAQKNGHAGTLDPFATGVLPIAFGEATKLIDVVMSGDKEYEFVVEWGLRTDTGDNTGEVVESSDARPSEEAIRGIIPSFLGKIKQVPPAYSAIKINGQRAYKLARMGQVVEVPEREVELYALELLEVLGVDKARFRVACSKGTYVRTLGQDIALVLGTVGVVCELRRTKCGNFSLKDTILLENLKDMVYVEERKQFLLPISTSLRDIAVMAVSEADAAKLRLGQGLSPKVVEGKFPVDTVFVASSGDELVAIVRVEEYRISPIRVFNF